MNKYIANIIEKLTLITFRVLSVFFAAEKLEKWKPIHLCWWYYKHDMPIPKYFIGKIFTPSVSTQAVTSVSYTTATANGNITSTGNENASRRGFCYMVGTAGDPTTTDSVAYVDGSFGTGAYTQALSGLAPGTGYRVRAYAINSAGTGYGATVQMTTATNNPPTVVLNSPANGSSGTVTTPTLNFTGTDAQSEAIEYNLQIDTLNTFNSQSGSPLYSVFSITEPGFTAGHPFASGSAINYTTQPLTTGTYYWRVAGTDPTGSNTYGAWSSTRSIIIAEPPFVISGTSNQTSGTVAVAVNSTLQGSTGTIAGDGTWSISGVTKPNAGDTITVFVSNATTANVSTAVATYFGIGAVSAMVLNKHVLSIGSNQNVSMTLSDLAKYDYDQNNTKILHSANGSPATLLLDPGNLYSDEKINILAGNTLTIGATETLTTYDMTITGTLISSGASTYNIKHDWLNSGVFAAGSSTVYLNGTSKQTLSGTMTSASAFYNLDISNNSGSSATDNERTGFVPSVDFNAAATVDGTYSINTGNVRVEYETGATYRVNIIDWSGAAGQLLCFRNSTTSGSWLLQNTNLQMDVSYINVSRSDASVSGGLQIGAFNATNYDGGNNTNWLFINKRIRQEINLLTGTFYSLAASGVLAGYASLYTNFGGTLTSYFEILAINNDSTTKTIYLRNQATSGIVGQIDIPAGTSSPKFFRSVPFTYPASTINVYIDIPQTTSNSQIAVSAARVVVLQDMGTALITATETQIEIGNYESGRSNTASTPLAYPKYWKYTSSNWAPAPSFVAEVTYDTSSSANNAQTTITLQKDNNGDLVTWSDVIQISAYSTSVLPVLSSRVGFTPVTGCNYRIASFIKNASYSHTIYNAKIIAVQTSLDISRIEPQYLIQNTYKNVTGLQDYDTMLSPLDWYGANMTFYHEINTSSSTTASAKLQFDPNSTPVDYTGSTATGLAYVSRSVGLFLTHARFVDTNIVTVPIYASRIIAVLNTGVAGTGMKVWTGLTWGYKPARVWNGSAWVAKPVKVWDGSGWVIKG